MDRETNWEWTRNIFLGGMIGRKFFSQMPIFLGLVRRRTVVSGRWGLGRMGIGCGNGSGGERSLEE